MSLLEIGRKEWQEDIHLGYELRLLIDEMAQKTWLEWPLPTPTSIDSDDSEEPEAPEPEPEA